jgi:hypothetical protein
MGEVNHYDKSRWWDALIGFAIVAMLSHNSILPTDVGDFHFSVVNVCDLVRVAPALTICMVCAWMGYIIGKRRGRFTIGIGRGRAIMPSPVYAPWLNSNGSACISARAAPAR